MSPVTTEYSRPFPPEEPALLCHVRGRKTTKAELRHGVNCDPTKKCFANTGKKKDTYIERFVKNNSAFLTLSRGHAEDLRSQRFPASLLMYLMVKGGQLSLHDTKNPSLHRAVSEEFLPTMTLTVKYEDGCSPKRKRSGQRGLGMSGTSRFLQRYSPKCTQRVSLSLSSRNVK